MPTNTKWAVPTAVQTLMQTVLDDLADGDLVVSDETSGNMASGVYDNTTALDLYADFDLAVAYGSAPDAGTKVAELYLLPSVDGTDFAVVDVDNQPQKALLIATFESRNPSTTVVEHMIVPGISLPPGKFMFVLKNTGGEAFASSGVTKTLKMRPFQLQNA